MWVGTGLHEVIVAGRTWCNCAALNWIQRLILPPLFCLEVLMENINTHPSYCLFLHSGSAPPTGLFIPTVTLSEMIDSNRLLCNVASQNVAPVQMKQRLYCAILCISHRHNLRTCLSFGGNRCCSHISERQKPQTAQPEPQTTTKKRFTGLVRSKTSR